MSLSTLANTCSHLQNAAKARLALTSLPNTKRNLNLSIALQRQGFLSTVTRGGPQPPLLLTPTSMPHATNEADMDEATVTQANVATRRLWLGLKYWNSDPVMREVKLESWPKRKVTLKVPELTRIVKGREAGFVKGLTRPGECLFLDTDQGVLEAREAVQKRTGGLVLCRVY